MDKKVENLIMVTMISTENQSNGILIPYIQLLTVFNIAI